MGRPLADHPADVARITLRIPQHMLDRIDLIATGRRRSRNSEILSCIEYAMADDSNSR